MSNDLALISEPPPARKPDAIIAHRGAVADGTLGERAAAYRDKYGPVFGCRLVALVHGVTEGGGKLLLPHGAVPCLYFPTAHPRHPEPRYEWVDQPTGDKFGYFVDDEARNAV